MAVGSQQKSSGGRVDRTLGLILAASLWIMDLSGWRRWALSAAAGALAVLALAPYFLSPVLLVSFPVLIWLLDGTQKNERPLRAAAAIGWWFGFGFHMAGLYWIGMAFLVDAETYAWLIPFVAVLMPGGLALFTMLAAMAYAGLARKHSGWVRVLDFAVIWMALEWLRGHILTGFPWNLIGYTWGATLPVAQTVSVIGIYGLSLLTLLIASAPAALVAGQVTDKGQSWTLYRRGPWGLASGLGLLLLLSLWGGFKLAGNETQRVEGVKLRLVQPSVPQSEKWRPENRRAIFDTYLRMSSETPEDVTHIIWPESAVPMFLQRQPVAREMIGKALGAEGTLLTGAVRLEQATDKTPKRFFNSVFMLDSGGHISGVYDKHHLVPFGEYLPADTFLRAIGFSQLVASEGGYSPGPRPHILDVPGAGKVLPMVCYEVIFPGPLPRQLRGEERPHWVLNVTNDAWYGDSSGPRQHLTQAQFRAIELGLPLVRSANTGISAVFDAHGRIMGQIALNETGTLDVALPKRVAVTLYSRVGDWPFFGLLILAAGLSARHRRLYSAA